MDAVFVKIKDTGRVRAFHVQPFVWDLVEMNFHKELQDLDRLKTGDFSFHDLIAISTFGALV